MSTRTTTVRASQTTTKSKQDNASTTQQDTQQPSQDRCAHCKKHPETHSPTGCAQKAREQTRQQFQRDSGHILGAESHDRGSTHRPGWNIEASRQDLHQRLNQRVQSLKESSGRTPSAQNPGSGSGSGSGAGAGAVGGGGGAKKGKGSAKKTANKPKTWGSGGSRLGGVPGSAPSSGPSS
ncbi:hypothetical protein BGZ80_001137 [Entomortierella chlamydospora]|uniref:Uncharacterized protein n=1 Tax=Entomortierella chlamydospora TaxID=101097 RepID=A0A9P6SXZ1_9FUNG|nr:hypothetical protein BGZ80_001137 [Entomortierella chlamydospora]